LFPETSLYVRVQYVRTPFLIGILITSGSAFFGFFLNGNFLFSGQPWHDGPTSTPSLSARPNKHPKKFSAGHTSCICILDVGSKLKAARFAEWALVLALRQIHLAKYVSPITVVYHT
jgi:hypothetical protein